MGVDTKAIIRKGVSLEEIKSALENQYADVEVLNTSSADFFYIVFSDGKDKRQLAISYNDSCLKDNGIDGIWCSLGLWKNSIQIMRYLCETFGGYLDENDCDDEDFYPINFHLFQQGKDFTKMDLFSNKVITELGYGNLHKALNLFNEFKAINDDGKQ